MAISSSGAEGTLAHGTGKELVQPDWPPLTEAEAAWVLAAFRPRAAADEGSEPTVTWRSPRPASAAAIVTAGSTSMFVKRHHVAVRAARQLRTEHAFADWLCAGGQPVPAVLRRPDGTTVLRRGDFVYEAHAVATGLDLYRDAMSWTPFANLGHAAAAGAALARFHLAAAGCPLAARPPGVLVSSTVLVTAAEPEAALAELLAARPALDQAVARRPLDADFARWFVPAISTTAPLLASLPSQWSHGDWHASNLMWSAPGPDSSVTAVLDLGLSNLTSAPHDLAVAIERNAVDWLDFAEAGRPRADLGAVEALVRGYEAVRPLGVAEKDALVAVLPVAHLEYALSEVEYFAGVVTSPANTDAAYDDYLVGHARWFEGPDGVEMMDHLRGLLGRS